MGGVDGGAYCTGRAAIVETLPEDMASGNRRWQPSSCVSTVGTRGARSIGVARAI